MSVVWIGLWGALGCVVRFALECVVRLVHPTVRPWATVGANGLGCLVAGWAVVALVAKGHVHLLPYVTTGFCGGVTTFSSAYAVPAIIAREHHVKYAVAIYVATPLVCVATFLLGTQLAAI